MDREELMGGMDPAGNPGDDPWAIDSDGDGLGDGGVALFGTDPNDPDSDDDLLSDADEQANGTDPNNPDTDGGGTRDAWELFVAGTNPLDPLDDIPTGVDTDLEGLSGISEFGS